MISTATDMVRSYVTGPHGIEAKRYRPRTKGEARDLVKTIFEKNRWDERSQRVYMQNKGVEPKPLEELSIEDLRKLVDAMDRSRMVIFAD